MNKKIIIPVLIIISAILAGAGAYYFFVYQKNQEDANVCSSCLNQTENEEQSAQKTESDLIIDGRIVEIGETFIRFQAKNTDAVEVIELKEDTTFKEMTFLQESAETISFQEEKDISFQDLQQGDEVSVFLRPIDEEGKKIASAVKRVKVLMEE